MGNQADVAAQADRVQQLEKELAEAQAALEDADAEMEDVQTELAEAQEQALALLAAVAAVAQALCVTTRREAFL